MIEQEVYQTMD